MDEKLKKTPRESRVLTAHVPQELAEKVDTYAQQMDRSRGWIVKQALEDWVAWEEKKYEMTLEGLADVDAGRTIPHEEVEAWAKSLATDHPLPRPKPRRG